MNQEFFLGGGGARTSLATFFSHPFARTFGNSDQNGVLIDVEPQIHSNGGDGSGDSAAPVTRESGYSRPFLFLDMMWNLAFVAAAVFVLLMTVKERPSTPLRLWVCGYALQCLLHVGFVWDEYQRRSLDEVGGGGIGIGIVRECCFPRGFLCSVFCRNGIIKKLESINTIISSVWWVFGFYWIVNGGQPLLQDSPRLYWLSVVFLAFDVFFILFCIAMVCIFLLLLVCCFPFLASAAYAMTVRDGASENDIGSLPKYLYRPQNRAFLHVKKQEINSTAVEGNGISMADLVLPPEDSECCICLFKYVDGAELCSLPCSHHFHHKCVTKWLRINATCPLCKCNVLRGDMLV